MVVFATSANQAVIQVVKGLDGNAKQIRRSIFIGFGLSSVFVPVSYTHLSWYRTTVQIYGIKVFMKLQQKEREIMDF